MFELAKTVVWRPMNVRTSQQLVYSSWFAIYNLKVNVILSVILDNLLSRFLLAGKLLHYSSQAMVYYYVPVSGVYLVPASWLASI